MWANKIKSGEGRNENGEMSSTLKDGAKVIHRTDYNYSEVADNIVREVLEYASWDKKTVDAARKNAAALAEKALWKHFIQYYFEAYDIALRKAELRKERLF